MLNTSFSIKGKHTSALYLLPVSVRSLPAVKMHATILTPLLFTASIFALPSPPQSINNSPGWKPWNPQNTNNTNNTPVYDPSERQSTPYDFDLIQKLELAATAADHVNLLSATDFQFDFKNPPAGTVATGAGGKTVAADRKSFPALIGNDISMTVGFIGPCGINTPHTHNRASEINIVVQG